MCAARAMTAYSQVADALRRRILAGEFAAGAQLPTEQQLCLMFSASRITIRRALQILEEEMLVQRRQGSGTFVSAAPSRKIPLLNTDFSGSVTLHAPELQRQLEEWGWRTASPVVAAALQTTVGQRVVFSRRIDLLGETPVAFDEVYLIAAAADRLSESDLAELQFLERWQEVQQIRLSHLTQAIEAVPAGKRPASLLGVKSGSPLLKETDVVFQAAGGAIGLFISYYRHDMFRLTATTRLDLVRPTAIAASIEA